jgi:hypothetical protein
MLEFVWHCDEIAVRYFLVNSGVGLRLNGSDPAGAAQAETSGSGCAKAPQAG